MAVTPFDLLNPAEPRASFEVQKARIDECKKCERLISITKTCKECGCFMPLKTTLEKATCPLGKW